MSSNAFFIYLIRNQINGKVYVGQTTQSLCRRWQAHIGHARRADRGVSVIGAAILKHGHTNFKIELLEVCDSQDALNFAECKWIDHFNSYAPNGYNLRQGGSRGAHAESTKQKLRNRIVKESTKEKLRGRVILPKTREKLSAAAQRRPVTLRMRLALLIGQKAKKNLRGEKNPNAKVTSSQAQEIRHLYQSGEHTQQELAELFGVKQVTISAIVTGKRWKDLPSEY